MPMKIEVCKVCHKPAGPVLYSTTGTGDCTSYELHCEACGSVWEGYEELTVHTQAELDEAVKAAYEVALSVINVNWNKTNMRITEVRRYLEAKIKELKNG